MGWAWDLWRANAALALAVLLLLAGLGVPSPASIAIIATGALVRHGGVSPWLALAAGIVGSLFGSWLSYAIAARGLEHWLHKKMRKPAWARAMKKFEHDAWTTIFLSRWLLTPLGLPISYLAGGCRYSQTKYLSATAVGSALWVLIYGGLGYAFAGQWRTVSQNAKVYGAWAFAAAVLVAAVVFLIRRRAAAVTPSCDAGRTSPASPTASHRGSPSTP